MTKPNPPFFPNVKLPLIYPPLLLDLLHAARRFVLETNSYTCFYFDPPDWYIADHGNGKVIHGDYAVFGCDIAKAIEEGLRSDLPHPSQAKYLAEDGVGAWYALQYLRRYHGNGKIFTGETIADLIDSGRFNLSTWKFFRDYAKCSEQSYRLLFIEHLIEQVEERIKNAQAGSPSVSGS